MPPCPTGTPRRAQQKPSASVALRFTVPNRLLSKGSEIRRHDFPDEVIEHSTRWYEAKIPPFVSCKEVVYDPEPRVGGTPKSDLRPFGHGVREAEDPHEAHPRCDQRRARRPRHETGK